MYHPDLLRNLAQLGLDERVPPATPAAWQAFLAQVSRTCEAAATAVAEAAHLHRSLSLVRATLESTADGLLVVGREGEIVDYNQKFAEMWGIPTEVLAARDDEAALAYVLDQLADPEGFLARVRALYEAQEEESLDVLHFKDGRVFERYSKALHLGEEVAGRVWSFRDVTEQRRAEAALEEEKRKAEASAAFKTTILNNLSHEIRTPITSILGYAQVLSEELQDEQAEFITYINNNSKRLLDTLNSILDLSRIDAGEARMQRGPVDLAEASVAAVSMLAPMAMRKGIDLRYEGPYTPLEAHLDAVALNRILHNLVDNAIKFTEAGEVVVEAGRRDGEVYLRVRDTGIGISEAFLPHVFEEFRQESSGLDRQYEGSGLGLAITRRLVEALGGTITVQSRKGEGSTFEVAFPAYVGTRGTVGAVARPTEEPPGA